MAQVATNYDRVLDFLKRNDIEALHYLNHVSSAGNSGDERFPTLSIGSVPVHGIQDHISLQNKESR